MSHTYEFVFLEGGVINLCRSDRDRDLPVNYVTRSGDLKEDIKVLLRGADMTCLREVDEKHGGSEVVVYNSFTQQCFFNSWSQEMLEELF